MTQFKKGDIPKSKGKTIEELYGIERANQIKSKIREARGKQVFSEETRKKLSENAIKRGFGKDRKGIKLSPEQIKKGAMSRIGRKVSEETRKKIRESNIKTWSRPEIRNKVLGKNSPMYGKHHSVETREKLSKSWDYNKHQSSETRNKRTKSLQKVWDDYNPEKREVRLKKLKKVSPMKTGHKVKPEWIEAIRKATIGRKKTPEETVKRSLSLKKAHAEGKFPKITKEAIAKLRLLNIGKKYPKELYPNHGMRGKKHSDRAKELIRLSSTNLSPERRQRLKDARAKVVVPFKDTSIEIKLQNFLSELHIEYIAHKYISKIPHQYQCDIYIPSLNVIIECDGCFWHGCLICNKNHKGLSKYQLAQIEKDKIRTQELFKAGFKVLRLWEHDIKSLDLNKFKEILL